MPTPTEDRIRRKHLPHSKPLPPRKGGQGTLFATKRRVIKITQEKKPEEYEAIDRRIRRDVDPEGHRFVRVERHGEAEGHFWQVMERLRAYPKTHTFTDKQKRYLRESVMLLFINDVMGHGDIKSDNVMYRGRARNKPIFIDIDTVLITPQTKEHVITTNLSDDLDDIDDL